MDYNGFNTNSSDIDTNTKEINMNSMYTKNNHRRINNNSTAISDINDRVTTNTQNIASTNRRIDSVMNDMKYLDRNLSAGIASAVAMGQHQFDPSYQGRQVSLSGGVFNGENAISFAVGVPVSTNAFFNASVATNSGPGNDSIGMGLTFKLPK